jgi:two-component system, OmpR family, sensor histidine kinase CiaH
MRPVTWYKRNKLSIATWVYWFLLAYIIAALVWWFIELLQQNHAMYLFRKELLNRQDPGYAAKIGTLEKEERTNVAQYVGEGLTFMLLTLIGSVFVYRAVRRQIRLKEQQQNFMMAVTHELKTPIAITKLNLETLQKRKLDPQQQERLIGSAIQETGRLNDLCENILLSTRIDAGRHLSNKEDTDLAELLGSSVRDLRSRFPRRTITTAFEEPAPCIGDPLLLRLMFNNLIENAVKYSPADSPVEVVLRRTEQRFTLEVKDLGVGIPEPEKKKIFEKFYRLGHEDTRVTQGTGLGLYLSQKIAEDHQAQIKVRDNQPRGSIFVVEFS